MRLLHTSPSEIISIEKYGKFDDCLFFVCGDNSDDGYQMAVGEVITYALEVGSSIEVGSFFYQEDCEKLAEIVAEIAEMFGVDNETAEEILSDEQSAYDFMDGEEAAEASWKVQALQGKAAKALGYEAAQAEDEQGAVYIVPMAGRELELTRV